MMEAEVIRCCLSAFVNARKTHFHPCRNQSPTFPFRPAPSIDFQIYAYGPNGDGVYVVLLLNSVRNDGSVLGRSVRMAVTADYLEISAGVAIDFVEEKESTLLERSTKVATSIEAAAAIKQFAAEVCAFEVT